MPIIIRTPREIKEQNEADFAYKAGVAVGKSKLLQALLIAKAQPSAACTDLPEFYSGLTDIIKSLIKMLETQEPKHVKSNIEKLKLMNLKEKDSTNETNQNKPSMA